MRASHGGGFSCCGAQAPGARTSVAAVCGLSCGSQAQQLEHMDSVALRHVEHFMPEIEPRAPALAGDSDPLNHQGSPIISNLSFLNCSKYDII